MESKNSDNDVESLSNMFKEGLELYTELNTTNEPTCSPSFQANVKKAITILENATRLVSLSGIFSKNEGIEEVATGDLQYFLLPALLGSLHFKLTSRDRQEVVNVADVYFNDFLQRCSDYGLTNYKASNQKSNDSSKDDKSEMEKLLEMANTRSYKIQRLNEKKELQSKLEVLKQNLSNDRIDEDVKRNYYLTLIKLHIQEAEDELSSIETEKIFLELAKCQAGNEKLKPKRFPVQPLKPVIITKDEIQKAVFGAGYPSLPTMTVQEFYDKRVREGIFPGPNQSQGETSLQEACMSGKIMNDENFEVEKEEKIENDDEDELAKARAMDEYKDDHRRGWGNRMNRS